MPFSADTIDVTQPPYNAVGDGVADDIDRCPEVPGPKENFGCPWPDKDGDGVPDKDDQCPDEPGPVENHGCPRKLALVVVRKDRIEIRQRVNFRPSKSAILPDSFELLRQVAQVIKDAPAIRVRIEGHTDNIGGDASNQTLSTHRAESVRDALSARYHIAPARLRSAGFGATRPREPNTTIEGRARNRRVELVRPCAK